MTRHWTRLLTIGLELVILSSVELLAAPIELGARRELFVDDLLIERLEGDVQLQLHRPEPHEVVLVTDQPWEGNTSAYYTVFRDGDVYRIYYRGSHFDEVARKSAHPEVTCYAESHDGIHWTKPPLGLFEFQGSTQNNIVWDGIGTHDFTPFRDLNPACRPEARYKAFARGRPRGKKGLYAFQSSDAIHWSLMSDEPVITVGAFDSQNLAFWDSKAGTYREYHRSFRAGKRDIMTSTSTNFLEWPEPQFLEYPGAPAQHLYTNAIMAYPRAPHILIGFPTRYLPEEGSRVEPTFMASRDGRTFHRWLDAVIPEDAPEDRGGNRSNYMAWGLVQLPHNDREYSVYATEAYYTGPDSRLRRFTYRIDGFTSLRGGHEGGDLITKPITFRGRRLALNLATRSRGFVQVALCDFDGHPLSGYGLTDCQPLQGDAIEKPVVWQSGTDLSALSGAPVRLQIHLIDADVFSLRFVE